MHFPSRLSLLLSAVLLCTPLLVARGAVTINSVSTDKAMYSPGAAVSLTVTSTNASANTDSGNVNVSLLHLGNVVGTLAAQSTGSLAPGQSGTNTFTWTPPSSNYQGYLVQVTMQSDSTVSGTASSAIDVSSDWTRFPRYGYISLFSTGLNIQQNVAQLKNLHINGLQFYDWCWKSHVPAPPAASGTWPDILGRSIDRNTVLSGISSAHAYNMLALSYDPWGAAWADYQADGSGVTLPMGRFTSATASGSTQDVFTLGSWAQTPYFYLMNNASTAWQNYIYAQQQTVFNSFPFDGWHMDDLDNFTTVYDYSGNALNLAANNPAFINNFLTSAPGKRAVFNDVDSAASESAVAQYANVDCVYTELWGNNPYYSSFQNRVNNVRLYGDKPIVMPAYMDTGVTTGTFNTPGVLLTDAAMFACGGAHIEMGDGNQMLSNSYFPNESVQMSPPLQTAIQAYYDFLVDYENLLRDDAVSASNAVSITGVATSTNGSAGTVWTISRQTLGASIVHLVNLANSTTSAWSDTNGTVPAPATYTNLAVKMYYTGQINGGNLWYASPDFNSGAPVSLAYSTGSDGGGTYVTLTLPRLQYWDMIWLEIDGTTTAASQIKGSSFASWSGIQTQPTSDVGGGLNVAYVTSTNGGSYVAFNNVDFSYGASTVASRVASIYSGATIEYHLDTLTGPIIATAAVPDTGAWQAWQTVYSPVSGVTGVHKLYVVFKNTLSNLNWFQFNLFPSPWSDIDIGTVASTGTTAYTSGTYTVTTASSDIWGTADGFHFLYQPAAGDYAVTACVQSIQDTDGWAKSGVMLRSDTSAGSLCADVVVTPSNGVNFQWRTTVSGSTADAQVTGVAPPLWVKLVRHGDGFNAYYGPDGVTWNQIGTTENISMATTLLGGLAASSHLTSATNTSSFSNVTVMPAPWNSSDIGSVGLAGRSSYTTGTFTSVGSGTDISGTVDAFQYVYQPAQGDYTITALVQSVQNTDPWAKAGVMFRNDTTAGSAYADAIITSGSGIHFQWRSATGAQGSSADVSGVSAPVWVQLKRQGNNFTAYYAPDGVTWTQMGSTTSISMGATALAGLSTTAHNNSLLCSSSYSNVSALPASWTDLDVGPSSITGRACYISGTYSEEGSGAGISGTADAFHYVYQPGAGYESITALVNDIQDNNSSAQTGVMFRNDATGSAACADVVATPGNGVHFQWRGTAGGSLNDVQVNTVTPPVWVQLVRLGNLFTGYYGTDGAHWTQLGQSQSISISSSGPAGVVASSGNAAGLTSGDVTNVNLVLESSTAPFISTTSPLSSGAAGAAYSQQFATAGGTAPLTWSLTGGSLPPGLALSSSGLLSGTPTASGTFTFGVQAGGGSNLATSGSFTMAVTLGLTNISGIVNASTGLPYSSATLGATGGTGPYTFTLIGGVLPPGLSLSSAGVLSGTPTTSGTYSFTVKVTDSNGLTGSQTFTIVTAWLPPTAATGSAFAVSTSTTQALVTGTINPNASDSTAWFEYGLTSNYGFTTRSQAGDNAESYSGWDYGSNSNGGSGFGPATYLEGTGGGPYLANASTGGLQIDGSNSFGIYAGTNTGNYQALCRAILAPHQVGTYSLSARFGVDNTNGFSGFNLKSAQGSTFLANELVAFGLNPATGNDAIYVRDGSGTQTINLGAAISGTAPIVDFQLYYDSAAGTYTLGAKFRASSTYTTVSGTMEAAGQSPAVLGFENANFGLNQNLVLDDLQLIDSDSIGSGTAAVLVSSTLNALQPNTVYHYRIGSQNTGGVTYGADQTFGTDIVTVAATTADAYEQGPVPGVFTIAQTASGALSVNYSIAGTAVAGSRYSISASPLAIASGTSATLLVSPIPNNVYDGNQTVTLTLASGTNYLVGSGSPVTVTIHDKPFNIWQYTYFGANWSNSAIAGDLANPSGDGICNLLKYALDGNPNLVQTALYDYGIAGQHLTLSFTRNAADTDVTINVQAAASPAGPWTNLATSTGGGTMTVVTQGAGVVETAAGSAVTDTVSDLYSVGDPLHPARFMRVQVQH